MWSKLLKSLEKLLEHIFNHKKEIRIVLLICYVCVVLYMTIFVRNSGTERIVKGLFWEIEMGYWKDILLNILFFIPIGILTGKRKGLLFGFSLSMVIEIIQYYALLGYCEADDVLNNTIGCIIGYLIRIGADEGMYKRWGKRCIDIILSACALPIVLLVILIVGPMIYVTDKGSIFYNADRLGRNGLPYKMYKLRSMKMNAPDIRNSDGSTFNGDEDSRVTRIGKFMRKTSIDEFPQFLNVLFGDMSIIGPRPTISKYEIHLEEMGEVKRKHYSVRPGITGYSQAYYRNSISQEQKYINDAYYADNVSLLLDIKIFFKTIMSVFKRENIYVDDSAKNGLEKK